MAEHLHTRIVSAICTAVAECVVVNYCDISDPASARGSCWRALLDLSRYTQVYAYGDTSEDREMLALAHRKYFRWRDVSAQADAGVGDA